jgi:caa(3)-type oxidase subunit IV
MTNVTPTASEHANDSPRARALVWLALLALTATSFAASDALGRKAALAIMLAALVKSGLVGFEFMEVRRAHPILRVAYAVLIGAVVLALVIAQRGV